MADLSIGQENNNNQTLNSTTNTTNTNNTQNVDNNSTITKTQQELMNKYPQPKNR